MAHKGRGKDPVTGSQRNAQQKIDRLGQYLERGEWVGTYRTWYVVYEDETRDVGGIGEDGIVEFKQLSNGNLEARIEWEHAVDDKPYSSEYIIALDPFSLTFNGLGYIDGTKDTSIANGYFEPRKGILNITDIGPSHGSLEGGTFIRNWVFVNNVW